MIKMSVDESFALDVLSIYEVKIHNLADPENIERNILNFNALRKEIKDQIGKELYKTIYDSQEYKDLFEANKKTFETVDKAKTDQVPASDVDRANYQRYLSKMKLQEKYFNNRLTETKFGYDKLK